MSNSISNDNPRQGMPAGNRLALKRTPLHALHVESGARMVPFAGYDMPVQYAPGVMKEHLHTRAAAGLFDVSHMGQIVLRPRSANMTELAKALEQLVPVDVLGLPEGRQRYAVFTNSTGGIIDDLMIGHCDDHFALVVNASRKDLDHKHLCDALSDFCSVSLLEDHALLALQGPAAETVLNRLAPAVSSMRFADLRPISLAGAACIVSRSGYTGEDGFEISVPEKDAERLARTLLQNTDVALVGLGARDSLRLESGLCLYGADIDEDTTAVEASLEWVVQKVRRRGGAREGKFLGAAVVFDQLERGCRRRRVGLKPQNRTPMRGGTLLFASETAGETIGRVTSGGFGPSTGGPIAMGYVPVEFSDSSQLLFADVRGHRVPVEVARLPFVPHRYKRQ